MQIQLLGKPRASSQHWQTVDPRIGIPIGHVHFSLRVWVACQSPGTGNMGLESPVNLQTGKFGRRRRRQFIRMRHFWLMTSRSFFGGAISEYWLVANSSLSTESRYLLLT